MSAGRCTSEAYLGAAPNDDGPWSADDNSQTGATAGRTDSNRNAGLMPSATHGEPVDAAASAQPSGGFKPSAAGLAPLTPAGSSAGICVDQGSFELAPLSGQYGFAYLPMPWAGCVALIDGTYSAPECVNETTLIDTGDGRGAIAGVLPMASDGKTYMYLDLLSGSLGQTASALLCQSLRAGHSYSFAVDLASRVGQVDRGVTLAPGRLAVYAQADSCSLVDPPLWTSPPLTARWTQHCVTFTPTTDAAYIALRLLPDPAGRAAIVVDNIRSVPGCGLP
jgi:hypothetical protein